MKKFSMPFLYILLAVGLFCILAGTVLLVIFFSSTTNVVLSRWPVLMLAVGGLFLYVALAFTHSAYQLFLGMNFCFSGILIMLFQAGLVTSTLRELWPVCVIFSGISLVPSGYFGYRRFRTVYLFPAGLLVFLGLVFFLFSFHLIHMSLRHFISLWWPVVLIVIGGLLVGIFLYQKNCKDVFPYMTDDSVDDPYDNDRYFDDSIDFGENK
jgi:hypothetical protein